MSAEEKIILLGNSSRGGDYIRNKNILNNTVILGEGLPLNDLKSVKVWAIHSSMYNFLANWSSDENHSVWTGGFEFL